MTSCIRIGVISDLHYKEHEKGALCRPAVAVAGSYGDPMAGLSRYIEERNRDGDALRADYLLCPGDITDKAKEPGFARGWAQLRELKNSLGAKLLVATTGNHEVSSRAGEKDDLTGGIADQALDPVGTLQRYDDYPSEALTPDSERWIYWGRGYSFIERDDAVLLVINSSHFHFTTRTNELERGRISDVAITSLRAEIGQRVASNAGKAFIALLHHHPIPFQAPGESRIDMHNGPELMSVLEDTNVVWLVIHGHKHRPRLTLASGGTSRPVVFSAGAFGAFLTGELANVTLHQFYVLCIELIDQSTQPEFRLTAESYHWSGTSWEVTRAIKHGLPFGAGYSHPPVDQAELCAKIRSLIAAEPFVNWREIVHHVPQARLLLISDLGPLRKMMAQCGLTAIWPSGDSFPQQVAVAK